MNIGDLMRKSSHQENISPQPEKPHLTFFYVFGLIERWTNDRYKSTMHRVLSPLSQKDRYTCAFFNDGALDTIIECIPTCLKPGETPLYGPLKVEDHAIKRYTQSYGAGGTEIKV